MTKKEKIIVSTLISLILICSLSAVIICVSYDNKIAKDNEVTTATTQQVNDGWNMSSGRYGGSSEYETETAKISETPEQTTVTTITETASTTVTTITETTSTTVTTITQTASTTVTTISETEKNEDEELSTTVPFEETTAKATLAETVGKVTVSNPVPYSEPVDESYFNDCVFVGDSIMEGMSVYGFFPESQVFASVGLNPYQLNTEKIDTYYGNVTALSAVVSARPSKMYIMMGMNGVAWNINEEMIEQIGTFIDNVKKHIPSIKIYLMSVTPVSAEREARPSTAEGKILNSQIDLFNSGLLELADEKGIHYLDVNGSLRGGNNCLPSNLTSDGIHISKSVYKDIISYMLSHTAE